jgi:ABC-type glycerol-3-phosphate transport system substrate-binding protein
MKKRLLRLALAGLVALVLAGCGGSGGAQPDTQPPPASDY